MKSKSDKYNAAGVIVFLVAITLFMYLLNTLTPIFFDDFRYSNSFATGETLTSVSQIIPSMKAHYYSLNGRLLLHAIGQLFLILGDKTFDIINAVAFTVLIVVINYHATGSLKKIKYSYLLISFSVIWIAAPSFGESFLWLIGSVNYLYGILISLICLIPYRFFYREYKKKNAFQNICLCVLAFVCGLVGSYTNENLSVAFFVIQICYWIAYIINKYKFRIWMIFCFIGNIFGTLFILSSPSYVKRSGIWKLSLAGRIITAVKNIPTTTYNTVVCIWFAICFLIICLTLFVLLNIKNQTVKEFWEREKSKVSLILTYTVTLVAWVYSAVLCDYFPRRVFSAAIAFILIISIMVIDSLKIESKRRVAVDFAVLVITGVIFVGSCLPGYFDIKSAKYKYDERQSIIAQAHKDNLSVIELKPIKSETKYSQYYYGGDISNDYEWINNMMARYYGFEKIIVDD